MIFLKLACPERFGTQGTAKPDCRTPGGASALVKILMYAIISRIALTSVGDGRKGRGGVVFPWSLAFPCEHPPRSCTCCEFLGQKPTSCNARPLP